MDGDPFTDLDFLQEQLGQVRRKVDLVLTVEKKAGRIVVEIEEKVGDLALGLHQRTGFDQVHSRMKRMACCFSGMVRGVIAMAAVGAHSGNPVMLRG
jgi:hypothetical protein